MFTPGVIQRFEAIFLHRRLFGHQAVLKVDIPLQAVLLPLVVAKAFIGVREVHINEGLLFRNSFILHSGFKIVNRFGILPEMKK